MAKLMKVCCCGPVARPSAVNSSGHLILLSMQMLQPLQSEYVDRRFDGNKVKQQQAVPRNHATSLTFNCQQLFTVGARHGRWRHPVVSCYAVMALFNTGPD
jgi:hypothetical protein